jgi:DNA-binding transcriptional regulator YiaG
MSSGKETTKLWTKLATKKSDFLEWTHFFLHEKITGVRGRVRHTHQAKGFDLGRRAVGSSICLRGSTTKQKENPTMNLSMTLSPIMEKVKNGFEHILDPALLRDLARKTLFVQRKSSKLDGEEFAILMSVVGTSLAYQALAAWEEALEKIKPSARMSPQALSERIDNEKAVAFMKAVFAHTLNVSRQGVREALGVPFLDSFHRVIITDSTEFTLNAKLAPDFAGPGGSASSSAMKILHAADLKAGNSLLMEVLPALVPDQALAERIANIVEAGDLVLWDLGFFVLAEMKKIVAKEAFLLSRMSSDAAAFLAETGERLDLIKYLSRRCRGKNVVDLDV